MISAFKVTIRDSPTSAALKLLYWGPLLILKWIIIDRNSRQSIILYTDNILYAPSNTYYSASYFVCTYVE